MTTLPPLPPTTTTLSLSLSLFFLFLGTIGVTSIHGFHLPLVIPPPPPPSSSSRPQSVLPSSSSSSRATSCPPPLAFAPAVFPQQRQHRSTSSRLFVASSAPEGEQEKEKKEESSSASPASSSSVDNESNNNNLNNLFSFDSFSLPKFDNVLIANIVSFGIVVLVGFVGFNFLTQGLSLASSAVMDEIGRELFNLISLLGSLLLTLGGAIFKLLQFVVPVVGKGIADGVTAATPVIQDVSTKVVESQLIQDATTAVNEVTAPIVDTMTQTVDSTVVAPIQDLTNSVQTQVNQAVDTNIVTPIKTSVDSITDSVTGAVDSTIVTPVKEATDSITHIFDSTFFSLSSSFNNFDNLVGGFGNINHNNVDSVVDITTTTTTIVPSTSTTTTTLQEVITTTTNTNSN